MKGQHSLENGVPETRPGPCEQLKGQTVLSRRPWCRKVAAMAARSLLKLMSIESVMVANHSFDSMDISQQSDAFAF